MWHLSQSEFASYCVGLIEGDGTFQRYGLKIRFHGRDRALAWAIADRLHIARKYVKTDKHSQHKVALTIYKGQISPVLNLINGRFVANEKVEQARYTNFGWFVTNTHRHPRTQGPNYLSYAILSPCTANLTGFWITGFFDADGSVSLLSHKRCRCVVSFSQTGGHTCLNLIGKKFGLKTAQLNRKNAAKSEYALRTEGKQKLALFWNHFDIYPCQGVKRGQMVSVRLAYGVFCKQMHLNPRGQSLFKHLHKLNQRCVLKSQQKQVYVFPLK